MNSRDSKQQGGGDLALLVQGSDLRPGEREAAGRVRALGVGLSLTSARLTSGQNARAVLASRDAPHPWRLLQGMKFQAFGCWGLGLGFRVWMHSFPSRWCRVSDVGFLGVGVGIRDLGLEFRDRARSGVLARLRSEVFLTPDLLPIPIQLESPFPMKASTVGGVVI